MALPTHREILRLLLIVVALSMVPGFSVLQQSPGEPSIRSYDVNAKMKGLFIYNFSRYIKWPDHMKSGDFIIGLFGEYESLQRELDVMAQTKKSGDQNFVVEIYNSIEEINKSHILYIVPENSEALSGIIKKINDNNYNTLILTDREGMAKKGAAINFYYSESKQRMEINPDNVSKYGLLVSSQLITVAKVVRDN